MKLCCSLFLFPCSPSPLKSPSLETESGRVYSCSPTKLCHAAGCPVNTVVLLQEWPWDGLEMGRGQVRVCSYCMATNATPCFSFGEIHSSLTTPSLCLMATEHCWRCAIEPEDWTRPLADCCSSAPLSCCMVLGKPQRCRSTLWFGLFSHLPTASFGDAELSQSTSQLLKDPCSCPWPSCCAAVICIFHSSAPAWFRRIPVTSRTELRHQNKVILLPCALSDVSPRATMSRASLVMHNLD